MQLYVMQCNEDKNLSIALWCDPIQANSMKKKDDGLPAVALWKQSNATLWSAIECDAIECKIMKYSAMQNTNQWHCEHCDMPSATAELWNQCNADEMQISWMHFKAMKCNANSIQCIVLQCTAQQSSYSEENEWPACLLLHILDLGCMLMNSL